MFKIGDKVKIKSANKEFFFIGGIHNHMTEKAIKIYFGITLIAFKINTCWEEELIGEIHLIGKENHYIIKCKNKYYVFCNDYKEMEAFKKQ